MTKEHFGSAICIARKQRFLQAARQAEAYRCVTVLIHVPSFLLVMASFTVHSITKTSRSYHRADCSGRLPFLCATPSLVDHIFVLQLLYDVINLWVGFTIPHQGSSFLLQHHVNSCLISACTCLVFMAMFARRLGVCGTAMFDEHLCFCSSE
jgi:hypothetical protein